MLIMISSALETPEDRDYMTELYQKYSRLMYQTAAEYLPTEAEREDVVQESVIRMINSIDRLRALEACALPYYIRAIVRNLAFDHTRVRQKKDAVEQPLEDQVGAVDITAIVEHRMDLSGLWSSLSEEECFLLQGKYLLGYTDAELAAGLRCKPGSIRMKLTRARRHAVEALKETERGMTNGTDDEARGATGAL